MVYDIYSNGKHYDDVFFQGNNISQVYIGRQLVWEKSSGDFKFIVDTSVEQKIGFELIGKVCVDWGDGYTENLDFSEPFQRTYHTYSEKTRYTIVISGFLTEIKFYKNSHLKEILTPFPKTMENRRSFKLTFSSCEELISIPENLFINCKNAEDFSYCFCYCYALTSIPEKLFAYCPNAYIFEECFYMCKGLTSIPEKLFANRKDYCNFMYCFFACDSLASIPEKLFDDCKHIISLYRCFSMCIRITSKVPELWKRGDISDYTMCFQGSENIANYADIPDDWK